MMSIPDELMWSYYELVTDRTPHEIAALKKEVTGGTLHPMDAKIRLAQEVIVGFHGEDAARKAADNFQRVFRDRQAPEEIAQITITREGGGYFANQSSGAITAKALLTVPSNGVEKWIRLLALLGIVISASEAERIMKQRGFEIDGQIVSDPSARIDLNQPETYAMRIGKKKFCRIVVE
jgi:tyrosyl-tRNA synthetase